MGDLVETGSKYTDEDRRRVVVEWCLHGNQMAIERNIGIPNTTISHWRLHSDWWDEEVAKVRDEINEQILAQNLTNAIKAGEALADRIQNGDQKLLKVKKAIKHEDGSVEMSEDYELRAEPMKGRDLAVSGGIVQDKARIQLNLPTSISSNQATSEQLQAVLDKCASINDSLNEKRANSIPGEYAEVVAEVVDQSTGPNTKKSKPKKIK